MAIAPQPFDPGYDYEADKDICERLTMLKPRLPGEALVLMREAAGEIRALRLLNKHMERTINSLRAELDCPHDIDNTGGCLPTCWCKP